MLDICCLSVYTSSCTADYSDQFILVVSFVIVVSEELIMSI